MRTQDDRNGPFPRGFARFNRKVANPVVRLVAGWLPPLAIIRHRGRITGREFATPVLTFTTPEGLVVGVLYGTTSDWVNNLLVAGHAQVKRRGKVHRVPAAPTRRRERGIKAGPGHRSWPVSRPWGPQLRPTHDHSTGRPHAAVERVTGIEPALSAWEADVLPLNYTRGYASRREATGQEHTSSAGRRRHRALP